MTDLQLLFLILAGIYLAECVWWIRPGSLVFVSQFGGRCRVLDPQRSAWLRNEHGSLVLGNLLPFGQTTRAHCWPLAVSADGVAALHERSGGADQSSAEAYFPWEAVETIVADQRFISINGRILVRAATPAQAGRLAALLERIRARPAAEREADIARELQTWLDRTTFARIYMEARRNTVALGVACLLLFAYVAVAGGLLLSHVVLDLARVFLGWFVLLFGVLFLSWRASGTPGLSSGDRWQTSFIQLVSPADAIHARDRLVHAVAEPFHPLAAAAVLCRPEDFQALALQTLLELEHPVPETDRDPAVAAAAASFRRQLRLAVLEFLAEAGCDLVKIARIPSAESADAHSYCRRCRGQYRVAEGVCSTCGLPLQAFAGAPELESWAAFVPVPPPPPLPTADPPAPVPPTPQPLQERVGKKAKAKANRRERKRRRKSG